MPLQPRRAPVSLCDAIIREALTYPHISQKTLDALMRRHLKGTHFGYPRIQDLVAAYRNIAKAGSHPELEKLLRSKTVRTDSGVAPITLLTKPYACPGKCVYCPTEVRMPKSYVASEPAAARALRLRFDPYTQVKERIETLEKNGHEAKKLELIIKGGTWSAYPWSYRLWFIKRCFDAANHLGQKKKKRFGSLATSQKANESALYRVIGLTIETRPDWIDAREIVRLRLLGVTRVELGVQALDDQVLALTKRGHSVAETVRATVLLKMVGFKTDYHYLPGQPGSTVEQDVAGFKQLFTDERFCPDMVKLYPCVVIPSAELSEWHKAGQFVPLEGEALIEAMIRMQVEIPYYCRVSRLIRDFPATEISGGNKVSNLRDVIEQRMKQRGLICKCLRCREAGHRPELSSREKILLFRDEYANVGGKEFFLSWEDTARTTCLSFLRLRLPGQGLSLDEKTKKQQELLKNAFPELEKSAFIRELHTYGQALAVDEKSGEAIQHKGLGRALLKEAERIAKEAGFQYLSVISGIGVRGYYRRLGYRLVGTYMRKRI